MSCDLDGFEEFQVGMERVDSNMRAKVQMRLEDWAASVEDSARQNVPVRSGYLRSTIFAKVQDWIAEIGSGAGYAAVVEFGSRYARAHPYFYPALREHLPRLEQTIEEAVDSAVSESGM
jgi:HK97 gp10 family phage protein